MTGFIAQTATGESTPGTLDLQHALRGRAAAVRHHPRHQHDQHPARPPLPGGLLMASHRRRRHPAAARPPEHGDRSAASVVFLVALWFALAVRGAVPGRPARRRLRRRCGAPRRRTCSPTTPRRCCPETAGARAAILGSAWVIGDDRAPGDPAGHRRRRSTWRSSPTRPRWYNRLIEVNLQNLAAVPAIVYGMLDRRASRSPSGCERRVVLGGAIALALLILPVIIITTREALRAVPAEIRHGSLALGATPLQTVWRQTLPVGGPRHRDRHDPRAVPRARRGGAAAAARRRWSSSPTTPTA